MNQVDQTEMDGVEMERPRVRMLPDGRMTRVNAATYLGYAEKTLAIWIGQGKGPKMTKVGGRCFYYKDDLDAFIQGKAA